MIALIMPDPDYAQRMAAAGAEINRQVWMPMFRNIFLCWVVLIFAIGGLIFSIAYKSMDASASPVGISKEAPGASPLESDVLWTYGEGVSIGAADQPMNVTHVEVKIPKDKSAEVEILADKVLVRFVEPKVVERGAEGGLCAHEWERQHASVILCTYPERWTDREVCRKCGKKVLIHCTGPYSVMEDGFWVHKSNGTETREEVEDEK